MIEAALYVRLSQVAGVQSLLADATSPVTYRIYRNVIEQHENGDGTRMPCLVLSVDGEERQELFTGTGETIVTGFQVDAYGSTYESARELADAARDALVDFTGTVNGVFIHHIGLSNGFSLPDPEPGLYRFTRFYRVAHVE